MDFGELFDMQAKLDANINHLHNTTYQETLDKRILAFVVEIGEFSNETRCFKYWSNKLPSPKQIQLEEYVDCLHFLMSIGLAIGISQRQFNECIMGNDLTSQLNEVLLSTSKFYKDKTNEGYYIDMFEMFLGIKQLCYFSEKEIIDAYYSKNKINYERQENNY